MCVVGKREMLGRAFRIDMNMEIIIVSDVVISGILTKFNFYVLTIVKFQQTDGFSLIILSDLKKWALTFTILVILTMQPTNLLSST